LISQLLDLLGVVGCAVSFRQLEEGFLLLSLGFDSLLDEFYQHAIVGGWPTFTFSVKVGTTRPAVRAAPIDQRGKDEDQNRGAGGMAPTFAKTAKVGQPARKSRASLVIRNCCLESCHLVNRLFDVD
jgi:hypothetical protein